MKKVIVLDLSNIAYICYYGVTCHGEDFDTNRYLKLCEAKIWSIYHKTKASKIVFAKDNYPKRKDIDSDYKANRRHLDVPIKELLINYLLSKNIAIYEAPDTEADDVMATLLRKGKVQQIVTTDQDLFQACKNANELFNPIKLESWTQEQFKDKYFVKNCKDILWYKSFFGDVSDNIPKSGDRIYKKDFEELMSSYKFHNWKELFKIIKTKFPDIYKKIDFTRLKLNYKLVKINANVKYTKIKEPIKIKRKKK